MYLHDSILWAVGPEGASGVNIHCDSSKSEEIATFFDKTFASYWLEAEDAVEATYGNCTEKEVECAPMTYSMPSDYGVKVIIAPLYLAYNSAEEIEQKGYADLAREKTLQALKEKYEGITYEGYIGYMFTSIHGSDVDQYEFSSADNSLEETEHVFDFVGEAIACAIENETFWDEMTEQLEYADVDDFKKVLVCLHAYAQWIPDDSFDRLLEAADEVDEEIRPELETIISAWENGEDVELDSEDDDMSNLPDGYMDALMALGLGEESEDE